MKQILPKIFMLFVLASSFALMSCKKEAGPVTAIIEANKNVVRVGESITLTNKSINSEHVVWQFDSASTSNSNSITRTFDKPGVYSFKLRAYNSEKESDFTEHLVYVGKVKLFNILIGRLNFHDENGFPWDNDGTGPDIEIRLADRLNRVIDFKEKDLPIKLINHRYDATIDDGITIQNNDLTLTINEFNFTSSNDYEYRLIEERQINFYNLLRDKNEGVPIGRYTSDIALYNVPITAEDNNTVLHAQFIIDISN